MIVNPADLVVRDLNPPAFNEYVLSLRQRVLEDDEAFNLYYKNKPCVRASTYGERFIPYKLEIFGIYEFGRYDRGEIRRPVIMLGSLLGLIYKYDGDRKQPINFIGEILDRYFQKIRYTCVDRSDHLKTLHTLIERLSAKFRQRHRIRINYTSLSDDFGCHEELVTVNDDGEAERESYYNVWIDGKYYEKLSKPQYKRLAELYKIIQLIDQNL